MPSVFLSHKSEDKETILFIQEYLRRALVTTWLDVDQIRLGDRILSLVNAGVSQCPYVVVAISAGFVRSDWCLEELRQARHLQMKQRCRILPVLLDSRADLRLDELQPSVEREISDFLEQFAYTVCDRRDPESGAERILKSGIWPDQRVRFYPVDEMVVQDQKLMRLRFEVGEEKVPPSSLSELNLNIEGQFLSLHDAPGRPFKRGVPVALSGKGPNWLYVYLSVPFKNLCPVYIYNAVTDEYVCSYHTDPVKVGNSIKA